VTKKTSKVPVFLIYAGIIHAIGLALFMSMLMVTLPGPASEVPSQSSAIDFEIVPDSAPSAKIEQESEQTAALPSAPSAEDAADKPDAGDDVANVSPEAEPQDGAGAPAQEEPSAAKSPAQDKATPAKVAPRAGKKPVAQHSRASRPVVRRAAKSETKITPFSGALSGLFSPGAPANNRRR
jgi:hypothetical protein